MRNFKPPREGEADYSAYLEKKSQETNNGPPVSQVSLLFRWSLTDLVRKKPDLVSSMLVGFLDVAGVETISLELVHISKHMMYTPCVS